ncbi:MAG: hypothetical protein WCL50_05615 [Spirochaetota bacterium]
MKRLILAPLLLSVVASIGAPALFADEMTEVYRMIYLESDSLQEKYNAAQNLIALDDRSIAPVLAEAFEELIRTQSNFKDASEKALFSQTVRLLAAALGQYKYTDSARFLWDAVDQVSEPLAKAEALIAIGRMRALDYAERISLMLRNLNLTPTADTDSGEKIAYGCIIALEKLKDVQGFSPVFFATDAWYSQRIKQQATRSLPNITSDPTDPVKELIANEDTVRKIKALQLELGSPASTARKIETATLALSLGHLKADANKRVEAKTFCDLRKLALKGLITLKATNADAVNPENTSYMNGFDDEERLLGIQALGVNGSDGAATALSELLKKLNEDAKSGISDDMKVRLTEAGISAAALTRNPIVRPVLVMIANNNKMSGRVVNAANAAIKALK